MKTHALAAACAALAAGAPFFAAPAFAAANPVTPNPAFIGSFDRSYFPTYEWWTNTSFSTTNWTTRTLTEAEVETALAALNSDSDPNNNDDIAIVITAQLRNLAANTVLVLPKGRYTLRSRLTFPADNLRLAGTITVTRDASGAEVRTRDTTLVISGNGPTKYNEPRITFGSTKVSTNYGLVDANVTQSDGTTKFVPGIRILQPAANATSVTIDPGSNADAVADITTPNRYTFFYIRQPDGKAGRLVKATGFTTDTLGRKVINIDRPFEVPFTSDALIQGHSSRANCGIEDLVIERDATATHTQPNIEMLYADRIRVKNIESRFAESSHIYVYRSNSVIVEDSQIHHAWHTGVGGRGYGVVLTSGSTRCRVSGNSMYYLRHATLIDRLASFNVVNNNYLRSDQGARDERFHGYFPFANLYEGNDVLHIEADFRADLNGPLNTLFRNRADHLNMRGAVSPSLVLGNLVEDSLATPLTDDYFRANRVAGTITWGAGLNADSAYPASLFRPIPTGGNAASLTRFGPDRGYTDGGGNFVEDFGATANIGVQRTRVPEAFRGDTGDYLTVTFNAPRATLEDPGFATWPGLPAGARSLPVAFNGPATGLRAAAALSDVDGTANDRFYLLLSNETSAQRRLVVAHDQIANGSAFDGLIRLLAYPGSSNADRPFAAGWPGELRPYVTDISATLLPGSTSIRSAQQDIVLEPGQTLFLVAREKLDLTTP